MSYAFCLGQFILSLPSTLSTFFPNSPQEVFLQRGTRRVHVWCISRIQLGDICKRESDFLGPLLGPIGSCSRTITKEGIQAGSGVRIRAYVVNTGNASQIRGCIFSLSHDRQMVSTAFEKAGVELTPIWNYNPRIFFDIPHVTKEDPSTSPDSPDLQTSLTRCRTQLKHHQISAIEFLTRNESFEGNQSDQLWNHSDNDWIRQALANSDINLEESNRSQARGSILADDMGLGKTLTTLMLIGATGDRAEEFRLSDVETNPSRSAATLVICPLATLSNWENEINIHFEEGFIPYLVFHGSTRWQITRAQILSARVVLTTYDMIGPSVNMLHTNQTTISSLNICWFRIVLDEAHLIRNPTTHRTLNIQKLNAEFFLCLTGTPFQNRLTDVQSLITLLKIFPWDQDSIWRRFLIPGINVGTQPAIRTLNRLMEATCLRRTKDVLLNLPAKVEKAVVVRMGEPWEEFSKEFHQSFIQYFGRTRSGELPWDPAEFFRQMTMIRQFCNHPIFARSDLPFQPKWRWQDSAKLVHLIEHLKQFLEGGQGVVNAKAVIFSSFVRFLEIIEKALQQNNLRSTWLVGSLSATKRDENLSLFSTGTDCNILLGSIQAAGVGIDLRSAQNVYVMEPSWNPAQEEQAVDRLYRLGQRNEVHVYRYYVQGTLEMNIHQVQQRKGELALLSVPSGGNEEYECAKLLMSNIHTANEAA